jgi:methylthioribose-1-phosphate isomerase
MLWGRDRLTIIDQTYLPLEKKIIDLCDYRQVAEAITVLRIRGAPAIGVAAAYGVVLAAREFEKEDDFWGKLQGAATELRQTRPTAVNLFWAIDKMLAIAVANQERPSSEIADLLEAEAILMTEDDIKCNMAMGLHGEPFIIDGDVVLTHCNAGSLATVDHGTALGVLRTAWDKGKRFQVYADETRPLLQGARLTVYELMEHGIPTTLITDNMAGHFMQQKIITKAITGADRIALNGDSANKIGTYQVAVLAKYHGLPFYVAAPLSTVDPRLKNGDGIIIEERNPDEVTHLYSSRIAPIGAKVRNPAFDVTPAALITAIITEKGVAFPPYEESIPRLLGQI